MDSGRVYRVGRDQSNDIVIEHGSVSRHHCELRLAEDGSVLLVDLDSMNGTAVRQNGAWEHVDKASVERDERILLGEIVTTVAALLMRAPKPAQARSAERPVTASPAPVQIPRKIPKPTAPAFKSENSNIMSRLIKSDWARLHRRSRNPKPNRERHRDEPSICLPAFVSAAEAEVDPARLMRSAPSLLATPAALPVHPSPESSNARIVPPPVEPSLALGAAVLPPPPPDAIAVPPRESPSLSIASRRADPNFGNMASSPPPSAPRARRRILPAWLPRASSPEFAKWAVVGSALLLMSGGAYGTYLQYVPETEAHVARSWPAPGEDDVKTPGAPETVPPAAKPVSRPNMPEKRGDEAKPDIAKPAAPKSTAPSTATRPWQRSIEGTPDSVIAAAAPSGDGLCLAGTTLLSGGQEAWILRTDAEGQVRWQRRPGGPKRDAALAVTGSTDGGCVAAGYDSDETRLWIFKVDAKGVLAWSRSIPAGHSGRAVAILRTRDGGYAVAAHARPASDKPDRAFVLRLSPKGEIKWSMYAGKGESRAADLRETRDGGFVVAGIAPGRDERPALWAARLDRNGHSLWDKQFEGPGAPESVRLDVARGTEFIIAAAMVGPKPAAGDADLGAALRLLRLSESGQVIWDRRHSGAARHVAGLVVMKGGLLVAGDAGDGPAELWLGQFDPGGRMLRESRVPATRGDRAAALAELNNGRIVLVGTAALETAAQRGAGMTFLDRDRQLAGR